MEKEDRMDLQCHCAKCEITFTINDLKTMVGSKVGAGKNLGELECPNCKSGSLELYLVNADGKLVARTKASDNS